MCGHLQAALPYEVEGKEGEGQLPQYFGWRPSLGFVCQVLLCQSHHPDAWVENECKENLGAKRTRCEVTPETGHGWWLWKECIRNKKHEGKILMDLHVGSKEREGSRMTSPKS